MSTARDDALLKSEDPCGLQILEFTILDHLLPCWCHAETVDHRGRTS